MDLNLKKWVQMLYFSLARCTQMFQLRSFKSLSIQEPVLIPILIFINYS